ncbi:phage GP46 family protein [Methylobacterium organophilum]|uniref:phage GP46 family protein n=1 Tax=Methylobacterium organophilum TaxID=410 RepID=UPI001F143562|nr:phage GP46 family protein [Methylobacterium organophilum]UMY19140.1 phage GP46 family protein [Methylobacterium organophilum]
MLDVRIRQAEGCDGDPYLVWDTVWSGDLVALENGADWALAGSDEPSNRGGLQAKAGLASAVILCLFTDRRCPTDHPLAYLADGDPRGWWGDAIDVDAAAGEGPLGSLLWLFRRAPLSGPPGEDMRRWAEQLAYEALEPLQSPQGIVARIACTAALNEPRQRIELEVGLYARDGTTLFARRFEQIWEQVA